MAEAATSLDNECHTNVTRNATPMSHAMPYAMLQAMCHTCTIPYSSLDANRAGVTAWTPAKDDVGGQQEASLNFRLRAAQVPSPTS